MADGRNTGTTQKSAAFAAGLRPTQNQLGEAYPLVLAGGKGWLMDDFQHTVNRLGLEQDVILLGYVDDQVLQWLYQNCFAFVYPSLFEGFGLPVLEAMSLGSVVIASNVTSIPEIVGEAGLLIDPTQEEDISGAMLKLATDDASRKALKNQALLRASGFSWQDAAKQVIETYQAVIDKSSKPRRQKEASMPTTNVTRENKKQPMSAISSRKELSKVFLSELIKIQEYNPAERLDSAQAQLLDVLFAYRLLLGRYPEFDDLALYRTRASGLDPHALVMSFIKSAEFQVRLPRACLNSIRWS